MGGFCEYALSPYIADAYGWITPVILVGPNDVCLRYFSAGGYLVLLPELAVFKGPAFRFGKGAHVKEREEGEER